LQERKRRDGLLNLDMPETPLMGDEPIELGAGYSIALNNTDGVTVVHVKTYGEVDSIVLRRKLQQHYPEARIEGLSKEPDVQLNSKNKSEPKRKKAKK